jgi:hypothetical protein
MIRSGEVFGDAHPMIRAGALGAGAPNDAGAKSGRLGNAAWRV